jgi:hypothetical protein
MKLVLVVTIFSLVIFFPQLNWPRPKGLVIAPIK